MNLHSFRFLINWHLRLLPHGAQRFYSSIWIHFVKLRDEIIQFQLFDRTAQYEFVLADFVYSTQVGYSYVTSQFAFSKFITSLVWITKWCRYANEWLMKFVVQKQMDSIDGSVLIPFLLLMVKVCEVLRNWANGSFNFSLKLMDDEAGRHQRSKNVSICLRQGGRPNR